MTMAQGGAVGSRRIPARNGFSALAIAGSSSLTLIAMRKGYHDAAPDNQSMGKVQEPGRTSMNILPGSRVTWIATGHLLPFGLDLNIRPIA